MARHYFGTDGVRGKVGVGAITPDFVLLLGQAAGRVLRRKSPTGKATVLIGKDTRVSGYMLEAALQAGLSSAGVDIVLSGPIPTPAVAYLVRALRLDAGIVISASHNPYYDNGIKFFSDKGTKFPDELEEEIEAEIEKGYICVDSKDLGKARRLDDAAGRYTEFCKSTIDSRLDLKGMKILVDCANGAAYHVAPDILHELGADVVKVGHTPDGFNINDGVGATHTEGLPSLVKEYGVDLAISLDGDADRLIMADANTVYNGDSLLYAIVKDRLERERVDGVVGTLMTNFGFERKMSELAIPFVRAKVGDRYVVEELLKNDWLLGGETSGHILVLDKQTTGDGMVSALQVLSAIKRSGMTLAQFTSDLELCPQVLINVRVKKGEKPHETERFLNLKSEVQASLGNSGRVLVRASGTEPLIRVMVEAIDEKVAQSKARVLADAIAEETSKI